MEKKIKDLGWANGWISSPKIVKKCREAVAKGEKHELFSITIGRCLTKYGCHTCQYTYKVDSSD